MAYYCQSCGMNMSQNNTYTCEQCGTSYCAKCAAKNGYKCANCQNSL